MAEGFWRHYGGDAWEVFSAGVYPVGVNPTAIEVMAELGIDISAHESQSVVEFLEQPFDLMITVCGNAEQVCPALPGVARREHWPFEDPVGAAGGDETRRREFRRVRDEIGARIRGWLEAHPRA